MKHFILFVLIILMPLCVSAEESFPDDKVKIEALPQETIDEIFEKSKRAKETTERRLKLCAIHGKKDEFKSYMEQRGIERIKVNEAVPGVTGTGAFKLKDENGEEFNCGFHYKTIDK